MTKKSKRDLIYDRFKAHYGRVMHLPTTWQELGKAGMRVYAGWLKKRLAGIEAAKKRRVK